MTAADKLNKAAFDKVIGRLCRIANRLQSINSVQGNKPADKTIKL